MDVFCFTRSFLSQFFQVLFVQTACLQSRAAEMTSYCYAIFFLFNLLLSITTATPFPPNSRPLNDLVARNQELEPNTAASSLDPWGSTENEDGVDSVNGISRNDNDDNLGYPSDDAQPLNTDVLVVTAQIDSPNEGMTQQPNNFQVAIPEYTEQEHPENFHSLGESSSPTLIAATKWVWECAEGEAYCCKDKTNPNLLAREYASCSDSECFCAPAVAIRNRNFIYNTQLTRVYSVKQRSCRQNVPQERSILLQDFQCEFGLNFFLKHYPRMKMN